MTCSESGDDGVVVSLYIVGVFFYETGGYFIADCVNVLRNVVRVISSYFSVKTLTQSAIK